MPLNAPAHLARVGVRYPSDPGLRPTPSRRTQLQRKRRSTAADDEAGNRPGCEAAAKSKAALPMSGPTALRVLEPDESAARNDELTHSPRRQQVSRSSE